MTGDLGRAALERGLVTPAQLDEARKLATPMRPIGDILVELGAITQNQLVRLLQAAPTVQTTAVTATCPYECAACMLKYDLMGAQPAKQYRCKKCDGLLTPAKRAPDIRPDETAAGHRLEVPSADPPDVEEAAKDPHNRFGRYILVKQLGRGGMGAVYKAWDPQLRRAVALKILSAEHPEAVERFHREAQTVARLKHPHIVSIYEIGRHEKSQFIAMEYVEGQTLDRLKRVPARRAADLIRDVADAVQVAHDRGIIHRDLKPANILVDADGRPCVTDFGLARETRRGQSITAEGFTVGTPSYMPPEQATGARDLDARADIYALGAVLYHALTDHAPFTGHSDLETAMNVVNKDLAPPSEFNPAVPRELELVVLKAMAKDRRRRYPTASALAQDLTRWLDGHEVAARPPSLVGRAAEHVRRNVAIVATIAVAAAAVAGTVAWSVRAVRESREAAARAIEEARKTTGDTATTERDRRRQEEARSLLDQAKRAQDPSDRIDYATRAVETWPLGEAYMVRAEALAGRDPGRAMEDFARAAQHLSSPVDALLARADLAIQTNRPREAVRDLRRVLELGTPKPGTRAKLAMAYVRDGDTNAALEAIAAQPEDAELLAVRSFARASAGRLDEAVEDAEKARPHKGGDAARVHAFALKGEDALPRADAERLAVCVVAVELEGKLDLAYPLSDVAAAASARFRSALHKEEQAKPELRRAVSSAIVDVGLVPYLANKPEKAAPYFDLARRRDEKNPVAVAAQGLVEFSQMRFDQSMECARRSLALDPDCLEGRLVRGMSRGALVVGEVMRQPSIPLPRDGEPDPEWLRLYLDSTLDYREFVSHSPRWEKFQQMGARMMAFEESFLARVKTGNPALSKVLAVRFAAVGQSRLAADDPRCAAHFYTRAVWFDGGKTASMHAGRARAHLGLKMWPEAARDAEKAVELDAGLKAEMDPVLAEARRH